MPRPREPLRLSHSTGNMAKPPKTWKNKSSKRKAEAKLTSCLPVRLSYIPAQWAQDVLVTSYHILLGQAPTSHPFTLLQGASPAEQQSAPAGPPTLVPKQSPRTKRQHPSPDPVDSMPLGRTTSKTTSEGPPASNSKRSHLWTRCSSRAAQKCSAGTLTWWRRLGRSISQDIPTISLWRAPAISQRHLHPWDPSSMDRTRWTEES